MNDESVKVSCALLFDFDLAGFDEWLARMADCPVKRELIERRGKLVNRMKAANVVQYNAGDDESCTALKRDAEFLKTQWLALRKEAVTLPLVRKEKNRRANLSTGDERHALWRRIADDIRAKRPDLTSKSAIAGIVRKRLLDSDDPEHRRAALTVDAISRKI